MTGPLELDALDVSGDTVVTSAAFASPDWEWLSPHAPATNAPMTHGMMMSFRMGPPPGDALARAPFDSGWRPLLRQERGQCESPTIPCQSNELRGGGGAVVSKGTRTLSRTSCSVGHTPRPHSSFYRSRRGHPERARATRASEGSACGTRSEGDEERRSFAPAALRMTRPLALRRRKGGSPFRAAGLPAHN